MASCELLQGFGKQLVFHRLNACVKIPLVVLGENGNGGLGKDGTGVHAFVHQVHGASSDAYACLKCLTWRMNTWEGGQQRRVNVDDSKGEFADHVWAQNAHEAGGDNPVRASLLYFSE